MLDFIFIAYKGIGKHYCKTFRKDIFKKIWEISFIDNLNFEIFYDDSKEFLVANRKLY